MEKSDGTKEMIQNHLIAILIVELHNDMIRPEAEWGLRGASHSSGNVIISNIALRDNPPFNLKPLKERHKHVCRCRTCHIMRECQRSLCQYCLKLLHHLTSLNKERGSRYLDTVFPKGIQHQQTPSEQKKTLYPVVDGCGKHHWKCVLGRCSACVIPEEEIDTVNDKIWHPNYMHTSRCTPHGIFPNGSKKCDQCSALSTIDRGKTRKSDYT